MVSEAWSLLSALATVIIVARVHNVHCDAPAVPAAGTVKKTNEDQSQGNERTTTAEFQDIGYTLLFKSNPKTWANYSVKFDNDSSVLPQWVDGAHFQIGPALFEVGNRKFLNTLDGFAKVNKLDFTAGKLAYSSRFIESQFYKESLKKNTIAPYLLFDQVNPKFSFWEKLVSYKNGFDNIGVNVQRFGGNLVALSDIVDMYGIDPGTLKTIVKIEPGPSNSIFPVLSTSHPVKVANSSAYVTFATPINPIPFTSSYIDLFRIVSATERDLIARIERSWDTLPYMHSLGLSPNYAIVFAHPVHVKVDGPLKGQSVMDSVVWKPGVPTDVYVVQLKDGEILKLQTEAAFFTHHVNSYEAGNQLIVDYLLWDNADTVLQDLDIAARTNRTSRNNFCEGSATMTRFTIDLKAEHISVTPFQPTPGANAANHLEMPRINEAFAQRKHCYVYGLTTKADGKFLANIALSKKDVCRPNSDKVWNKPNHYPAEPFFIAKPGGEQEDDGLLMSIILDGQLKRSYVGVFDARTMKLINRGYLPDAVPFLLHGHFEPL